MNDIYALAGGNGLHHAGLIRAMGEMYVLPTGGLIELAVDLRHASGPGELAADVLCHPTLMDGAAMASGGLRYKDRRQEQEGLFVPLACDSFRLSRPLQSRCFALLELTSFKSVNDIRKLDIDFFDAQGVQIAALQGLTAKLVRAAPTPVRIAGDAASIQPMLCEIFARYLKKDGAQLDPDAGFYEMGFKSADLLRLLSEIENRLDLKLPPSLLFEYTTVRELSRFLSEEAGRSPRTGSGSSSRACTCGGGGADVFAKSKQSLHTGARAESSRATASIDRSSRERAGARTSRRTTGRRAGLWGARRSVERTCIASRGHLLPATAGGDSTGTAARTSNSRESGGSSRAA